jgi:hypothetical protein
MIGKLSQIRPAAGKKKEFEKISKNFLTNRTLCDNIA